ncbi:MAG: DUF5131 family protein [Victivallales bacterium]|jgi:protein gp37
MNKTNIQYLDYTWNPIAMRCDRVSAGCDNCWHLRMAHRMKANPALSLNKRSAYFGGNPVLDLMELGKPLRKKNARIGVQFMGDLFHPNVKEENIHAIFSIMFDCESIKQRGNQFFILTKRPERMKKFLDDIKSEYTRYDNIWFGVSVENQETADMRIPLLLQCPIKHRWISAEPLLGYVSLAGFDGETYRPWLDTKAWKCIIDWVVCGCETGSKARPMHWDWAICLADQCKAANVPFFFKEPWSFLSPPQVKRRELPPCDCESCKDCKAKGF